MGDPSFLQTEFEMVNLNYAEQVLMDGKEIIILFLHEWILQL